ncbi:hypothetical protein COW81_00650 [Candidatus Campbellbacteria bacterium CG22_combo_CG10-13_8_21_14_all_36_13]|uniref:Ig-like domain-containing protein n=1 Tax=Candidatus Campbellbacteria bacterium CG22_combo_CG10-13_8_21_14_all_36_13 TaxID=1974529 RepID=A0A2H0DZF5_9BACT|nr:MAG: hypothetical protein COW81_00650 [Candidatus Campbellbacteria bacterium CG22_combo_CG10-13_8_21_14_all_36_13]
MFKFSKTRYAKSIAGVVGLVAGVFMLFGVVGTTEAAGLTTEQVNAIVGLLQSFGADAAVVANVTSVLNGGGTITPPTGSTTACTFTASLTLGSKGAEVTCLQDYLTSTGHYSFSGGSTGYFGPVTQAAVAAWQAANGVTPAVGYFGPISQAKYAMVAGGTTPPVDGGTTPPATPGTGLTVSAATQPAVTLAPANAARLPFTRVTFTAGNDGDVTVNSLVVQRGGLSQNAAFAGIVLLDENGTQVGVAKTLNSENQATLSEPFVVKAGQSRTMTIAANMASSLTSYAGEVASLSLVAVNSSATVVGVLPITGAGHTTNATLSIGSVTMARGSNDPSSSQTKEVGTTGYTFSSVKVTAGSAEKITLHSIRWNQTGSVSGSDLANLMTYVDGTAYPVTVSSDGKYYTSTFGSGITIDKGFSVDVSIKGDITDGSARTIDFDIARRTDINVSGQTYGYGIIPPQTGSSVPTADTAAFSSSENPWYDAAQVTVSAGSIAVSADTVSAPAQNVAVNSANQTLGAFSVEVRGESISVGQMVFNVMATGDEAHNVTNVTLVDANGAVLAGPVDGVDTTDPAGTLTFSDSVTFPVGITKVILKGKLGTTFVSNDTFQASTTPSTGWSTVTGQLTGNTITPTPSSAVTAASMTVKAGALAISQSSQPTARTMIGGAQGFEFARYVLDATSSGEDVKVLSFQPTLAVSTVAATDLTSCQLFDGTTAVNSGSNAVNPSAAGLQTFTFDGSGFIVPKGTAKTLSLKCNVSTGATSGSVTWSLADNSSSFTGASGVSSGSTIAETWSTASGQAMTASTGGSYTVTVDSSILYTMAQAGSTGVTLGAYRFTAGTAEDVVLKQIALQLGNTASNSPSDLLNQKVSLYHDGVKVGEASFVGASSDYATSTLTTPVTVTAGESELITVKADLASHDANSATAAFGAFIAVDYDGDNVGLNGNYATGVASGSTISSSTTSDTATAGVRVFRTVPSIAVTSTGGTLAPGGNLYSFTVTNPNNRDIVFKKFTFSVATTGGATTGFVLYGNGVAFNSSVDDAAGTLELQGTGTSQAQLVPANSSKTYVLKASSVVDTASVAETIALTLLADTSYPALAGGMGTVTTVEAGSGATDNIIWSPFSTTTPVVTSAVESNLDWTNGYGMPGFPSNADFPTQSWTRSN